MTMFYAIRLADGSRLVINLIDIVSLQEVRVEEKRAVCVRLRNGDTYLLDDTKGDVVDDLLAAALGYPDREQS